MSSTSNIRHYKTIIFDCDGVLLDSNQVKTRAFYVAAQPWGQTEAKALVEYHVNNGGISRYSKFDFFFRHIIGKLPEADEVKTLLDVYAHEVRIGLQTCDIAQGLQEFRNFTSDSRWMVVSGGDQNELRDVLNDRKVAHFFDGGIFGSPDTKDTILAREAASWRIIAPAVFIGDSRYDHEAAARADFDFIFVSGWTEFKGWQSYVLTYKVPTVVGLHELLEN